MDLSIGYFLVTMIVLTGFAITYRIGVSHRHQEKDNNINQTTSRHKVLANPIYLAYIVGLSTILIASIIYLTLLR